MNRDSKPVHYSQFFRRAGDECQFDVESVKPFGESAWVTIVRWGDGNVDSVVFLETPSNPDPDSTTSTSEI